VDAPAERSNERPPIASNDRLYGRKLGDFVLRERIGEGGFAAVYRCEQPGLGREAVIKVLHQRLRASEEVVQRFMREARLASRIDHPYAAHVYAFGVEPEDGLVWIAMEFVHGTSLEKWLQERGPLPLEQLVPFFEHVAEVVQNAHDHGIVHRDLKPSNVMMIERAGRILPKLLDFGIAKLVDDAAQIEMPDLPMSAATAAALGSDPTIQLPEEPRRDFGSRNLTQANATLGSPPYMSPEQWTDPLSVGPRSDLYSLGIMAYEALTGRQPFEAPSIAEIGYMHCSAEVPPVGEQFPPAIDEVFRRVLAKSPAERPASVLALASELRFAAFGVNNTLNGIPVAVFGSGSHSAMIPAIHATPPSGLPAVPAAQPAKPKRKIWPLAGGAAVLVAGAVVAYTVASGSGDAGAKAPSTPPVATTEPPVAPPTPPPAAAPMPPAAPAIPEATVKPAAPAMVTVQIASNPRGAEVFRLPSETKVGATPWKAELESEAGTQVFLVKKAGYADRRVEIDLRTGGTQTVTLQRVIRRSTPPMGAGAGAGAGTGRRKGEPVDPFRTKKTP
jgi:serine/threonine-protein kinase